MGYEEEGGRFSWIISVGEDPYVDPILSSGKRPYNLYVTKNLTLFWQCSW